MAERIDLSPIAAADEMLAKLFALHPRDANLTPQALRSLEILHSVAKDLGDCPLGDQLADGLWGVEAVLEVWGEERARMSESERGIVLRIDADPERGALMLGASGLDYRAVAEDYLTWANERRPGFGEPRVPGVRTAYALVELLRSLAWDIADQEERDGGTA